MNDLGVKDTAAFRVIRQIVDHTWSSDEDLDENDIVVICRNFRLMGGSWEVLLSGNVDSFQILEDTISSFMKVKELHITASRLANESFNG